MMNMVKKNNKVLLGLSGGVDSTAAALLLKEKGYEVTGYYFDVHGDNNNGREEARETAESLGIDLICEDVSRDFSDIVIDNFCREYLRGRTPNPCIICNPAIKFKKLIENADKIGAYHIATGHYCRIKYDEETDEYFVRRGVSLKKDQSYMLYRLNQQVLRRLIFPLGQFESKEDIRTLVREKNLRNAEKKDSQEICFINTDYAKYIESLGFSSKEGDFVDEEGNIFLGSMAEASIVRLLCRMVPEIYFLADETKLMKKDFIYICQLGKGRNLITNPSISEKCIHTYEQLGACVITE